MEETERMEKKQMNSFLTENHLTGVLRTGQSSLDHQLKDLPFAQEANVL